jgi:WD40 repeat protein
MCVSSDGTIVTGDSLGCVRFWDAVANTQMHSFQAHDADVLCLTVGSVSVYLMFERTRHIWTLGSSIGLRVGC